METCKSGRWGVENIHIARKMRKIPLMYRHSTHLRAWLDESLVSPGLGTNSLARCPGGHSVRAARV